MKKCKFSEFTSFLLCPSCFLSIHLVNGFLLLFLILGTLCDLMVFSDVIMRCPMLWLHKDLNQCSNRRSVTEEVGAEASAPTQHVL